MAASSALRREPEVVEVRASASCGAGRSLERRSEYQVTQYEGRDERRRQPSSLHPIAHFKKRTVVNCRLRPGAAVHLHRWQ
jgi:hypothetical protein